MYSIIAGIAISVAIGGMGAVYDNAIGGPAVVFSNSIVPGAAFGYPLEWIGVREGSTYILEKTQSGSGIRALLTYSTQPANLAVDALVWAVAVFAISFAVSMSRSKNRRGRARRSRKD